MMMLSAMRSRIANIPHIVLSLASLLALETAAGDCSPVTEWGSDGLSKARLPLLPERYYEVSATVSADSEGVVDLGVNSWAAGYRHYYEITKFRVDARPRLLRMVIATPSAADYPVFTTGVTRAYAHLAKSSWFNATRLAVRDFTLREVSRDEARRVAPQCAHVKWPVERHPASGSRNQVVNSSFELGLAAHSTQVVRPYSLEDVPMPDFALDESDAAHGTRSLRIDNRRSAAPVTVKAAECWRHRDSNCVYSVWLKADRDVEATLGLIDITTDWLSGETSWKGESATVKVTTKWNRFSVRPGRMLNPRVMKYVPSVCFSDAAVVWMDAEQFEDLPADGKPTDYIPAEPAEAAWVLPTTVFARNEGVRDVREAEFRTVRYHGGKNADVKWEKRELVLDRYGRFELGGEWEGTRVFPAAYAVVHRMPRPKSPQLARNLAEGGFYVGMNGGLGCGSGPADASFLSMRGSTCEDRVRWLRLFGAKMLRLHDSGLDWPVIEPRKGEFNWAPLDAAVGLCRKYGVEPMYVWGNGALLSPSDSKKDRRKDWFVRKGSVPTDGRGPGDTVMMLPSDADWCDFVRAVVRRYRGRMKYYETINEPNLQVRDGVTYAHFMEMTFDIVRAEDPDAIVVGICSTGDFNANTAAFVKEAGENGAFRYLDIMSFHPYNAPLDTTPYPAQELLKTIRKLVDGYRPACPMLEDELYYICDHGINNKDVNRGHNWPAGNLVRRYCLDAVGGCEGSVPIHSKQLMTGGPECPALAWNEGFDFDFYPSDVFVAGNAFAHFLEGGRVDSSVTVPTGCCGAGFKARDGRSVKVVWAFEAGDARRLTLPRGIRAYDLYGNRLAGTDVVVGEEPVYLIEELR